MLCALSSLTNKSCAQWQHDLGSCTNLFHHHDSDTQIPIISDTIPSLPAYESNNPIFLFSLFLYPKISYVVSYITYHIRYHMSYIIYTPLTDFYFQMLIPCPRKLPFSKHCIVARKSPAPHICQPKSFQRSTTKL